VRASASTQGPRLLLLLAMALTVLAYVNALANPFLYDDVPLVTVNALLRDRHGLGTFFTHATLTSTPVWTQHYRPILMLTLWLNYQLSGVAPTAYRLTNLAIHLVNGWLVFCVLRRVFERRLASSQRNWAAAFAASIFLLHPIQAIVINQVLKRNSSLCALLMLATLLLWAQAHEAATTRRRALLWIGAVVAGALAMLTKEDAVTLPALVALFALATGSGRPREALALALAPAIFVLRIAPHEIIARQESTALGHLLAQPIAFARYAKMLVWPDAIAVSYDLLPITHPFPWTRLAALLTLALVVAVVIVNWRRWPLFAVAVSWALVLLAPSSSVLPLMLTMDEVRCYAALIIFYGLAGIALERLRAALAARLVPLRSAPLLALAPWLILCVLALTTDWRINLGWSDALAQNQRAVAQYPTSQLGNRRLCEYMFERNLTQGIVEQCQRAEELWPYDPPTRYYLVGALVKTGRLDEAEREARAAVLLFPAAVVTWTALGHVAWMRDDYPAAAAAYRRVLRMDPLDDSVRIHLADTLVALGDLDGARALVRSFAGAPPGRPEDVANLARLAAHLGLASP
jgi:predicted Zn-dependent protease